MTEDEGKSPAGGADSNSYRDTTSLTATMIYKQGDRNDSSIATDDLRTTPLTATMVNKESVRKVFETVELLENVLLNLDIVELFAVQRTSKRVRDTIRGSVKLQRAMFLTDKFEPGHEPTLNPLLQQFAFKLSVAIDDEQKHSVYPIQISTVSAKYFVSPWLPGRTLREAIRDRVPFFLASKPVHLPEPSRTLFNSGDASWRKTYAISAPKRVFKVDAEERRFVREWSEEDPCKLGNLYDFLDECCSRRVSYIDARKKVRARLVRDTPDPRVVWLKEAVLKASAERIKREEEAARPGQKKDDGKMK